MKTSHVIPSPNISSSEILVAEKHHRKIVPSLHWIQKQKSVHAINHVNCRSLQKLEHAATRQLEAFFFQTEQWGKYDPAQPSPYSSDLCFWICSQSLSQLTERLQGPVLSRQVCWAVLVGTLANQTFS